MRVALVYKTPASYSVDNCTACKLFLNTKISISRQRELKTHYEILGLLNSADDVVIKAAYKALAQKYHPDKHKTNQDMATRLMSELNAAHAILGNKAKRKAYDAWLQSGAKVKSKPKPAAANAANTPPANYHELIKQLKHNLLDEIVVVELYEKFFACKVKIINGWVNSYAIQSGKKSVHLDFIKLKTRIIEHLEQL
jgi:curved DNA-binding protein CbpA